MKGLRRNIRWMAILLLSLFGLLVVYFSYSVNAYGNRWFANPANPRLSSAKQNVIAGTIYDRNDEVLASTNADGEREYAENDAVRLAVSHAVGDTRGMCYTGAETFFAQYLLGYRDNVFSRIGQLFTGTVRRGNDIHLTISSTVSRVASEVLGGQKGAVVVVDYKTGAIVCSVSHPEFDPENMSAALETDSSLLDRVLQGQYVPGSIFKLVTAAAALEYLPDVQERVFTCTGEAEVAPGVVVPCINNTAHGELTLADALARSCNVTMAQLGVEIGAANLHDAAQKMLFNEEFLFDDILLYSSRFDDFSGNADSLAWASIGQATDIVTPMHMAMLVSGIANGGVVMEPQLLLSATDASGQATHTFSPRTYTRILSEEHALALTDMMRGTTQYGTGTRAAIEGYTVCGKTGTAEVSNDGSLAPHAWYVGFIEEEEMPYAIAVVVENGGSGGSVAAPIARRVLEKAIELDKYAPY